MERLALQRKRRVLYSAITPTETVPNKQKTIQLLSGQEWLCRSILKEVLESTMEMVELMTREDMSEEWEDEPAVVEERGKRSQ